MSAAKTFKERLSFAIIVLRTGVRTRNEKKVDDKDETI